MKRERFDLPNVAEDLQEKINKLRRDLGLDTWSTSQTKRNARRMLRDQPHPLEVAGAVKSGARWLIRNRVRFQAAFGYLATKRYPFKDEVDFLRQVQPGVAYRVQGLRECFEMEYVFKESNLSTVIHRHGMPLGLERYGNRIYLVTGTGQEFGRRGLAALIKGEEWHLSFVREIVTNPEYHDLMTKPFWYLFEEGAAELGLEIPNLTTTVL